MSFCQNCGFAAEGALACVICGANLSGSGKSASQIGWTNEATHVGAQRNQQGQLLIGAPGGVFANRYKIIKTLGRGAMGMVIAVDDLVKNQRVALKVIMGDASDSHLVARFRREVRIASEIKHANALEVFDAGVIEGVCYYTMELIDGGSLAELLNGRDGLPFEKIDVIAKQLVSVVGAAHAKGVVHRDIKPSNVLLTKSGMVKLVDFGIAKLHESADNTQLSKTGMMSGTASYMAPEQIKDSKHVDGRADLYAIGIMLYELITGRPPFTGETTMSVAVKHLNETAPPLSTIRANVPPVLERIVHRLLEKDPAARFQSAAELLEALKSVEETSTRERMPNGDMLIVHRPGARYAVEIYTRERSGHFDEGQRVTIDGRNYRLVEKVEARPPFNVTLRFQLQNDADAIGSVIDYRAFVTPQTGGLFSRLAKKLRGD
jgi:serine/threonine protein kinase